MAVPKLCNHGIPALLCGVCLKKAQDKKLATNATLVNGGKSKRGW